jgi:hypothetical protein
VWLVVVFGVHYCSYLGRGGGGVHALVNLLVALVFAYGVRSCQLRFCRYAGLSDRRRVSGGHPSLCSASSFLPGW